MSRKIAKRPPQVRRAMAVQVLGLQSSSLNPLTRREQNHYRYWNSPGRGSRLSSQITFRFDALHYTREKASGEESIGDDFAGFARKIITKTKSAGIDPADLVLDVTEL